jgi:hypothetical protein
MMPPFGTDSARRHNKAARKSPKAQRAYAHAAESVWDRTHNEASAIKAGNAAAGQSLAKTRREKR